MVNELDENLDLSTFEFSSFGWYTNTFSIPAGRQSYATNITMPPIQCITNPMVSTNTLLVAFTASLNLTNRTATWRFETLDPFTRDIPDDPYAGFLPPNLTNSIGDGFVSYAIRPASDTASNTLIRAMADIVFDYNEAIVTPEFTNGIDRTTPTSAVNALPTRSNPAFTLSWSGNDNAGIIGYDIYVRKNSGNLHPVAR